MESNSAELEHPPGSLSTPDEPLLPLFSNPWKILPEIFQIKAAALARLFSMVFSLVSFSLMAGCQPTHWRDESFRESMEYRFCIAINVIVFVYSTFQAFATTYPILFGGNILPLPFKLYFDLGLDQVLAYLLIAAGASAAAIIKKTGSDPLANAAVSMAFLGFAPLASSAMVSAFVLSRHYSFSANKDIAA